MTVQSGPVNADNLAGPNCSLSTKEEMFLPIFLNQGAFNKVNRGNSHNARSGINAPKEPIFEPGTKGSSTIFCMAIRYHCSHNKHQTKTVSFLQVAKKGPQSPIVKIGLPSLPTVWSIALLSLCQAFQLHCY
jgi:hypothetical protein